MQGHLIILDLKHCTMCDAEQKSQLTDTGHFTIATSFLLVSCDSISAMITRFCSLVSQNVTEYCIDVATTVTDVTVRVKKGDVIVTAVTSPAAACPALFLFIFTHPLPAPAHPPVTGAQSPPLQRNKQNMALGLLERPD